MNHSLSPSTIPDSQPGADGLTLATYMNWIIEIQNQPAWRAKADRQMDFVDGNQLDSDILRKQQAIGMPPAIENLMGPAVEAVLGLEAKTRTDWRITSDGDEGKEVAEALNFKVNQAERKSGADKACTDAFKPQLCVGIGWVEVSRESDPFKFPYRCTAVHRNEIFWDMLDREPGLPKARYLVRRRWTDVEQVKLKFPQKAEIIETFGRNGRWSATPISLDGGQSTDLATAYQDERGWSIEEQEWRDAENGRVCLFEVWYRRWVSVVVLSLPDGRVVEYDEKNAMHVLAVISGRVKPQRTTVARMFVSFWMGPHKLYDGRTPYRHQEFPYVQFLGKVEDRTGVPYGVAKGMMYLQENVNSAISKIRWGLSAVRTTRTKGAYAGSDEDFRQQISRVDADIVLEAEAMAKPGAVFKVERDFQLTEQQYKMLNDARMGIQRCSGITASFEGQLGTATSGVQESTQIEQSTQSLASLMDNFKFARTKVGELLMSLVIEDMIGKEETVVIKGNALRADKAVRLNIPAKDEDTGIEYLTNDVERVRLQVAMNDVPSTPSFRTQQLAAMSEAFKSMPQEYQVVALPHLLSLMDVPNQDQLIEDIKNARQQATPEQIQARIDEAVKLALTQSDHDIRRRELDLKYSPDKLMAEIQKIISETVKNGVASSFASMQAAAQIVGNAAIAPVADVVMQTAGWRPATPAGQDPNFPQPAAVAVDPALSTVHPNTSPQLPAVPQEAGSPMTGIETDRTTDNMPA